MRLIDEQFMETPFYGSRQMMRHFAAAGPLHRPQAGEATDCARWVWPPSTRSRGPSMRHPKHSVFPYLLKDLAIERPNQVWCADITYIPMRRGFLYLVGSDGLVHAKRFWPWRVSNTMEAGLLHHGC